MFSRKAVKNFQFATSTCVRVDHTSGLGFNKKKNQITDRLRKNSSLVVNSFIKLLWKSKLFQVV